MVAARTISTEYHNKPVQIERRRIHKDKNMKGEKDRKRKKEINDFYIQSGKFRRDIILYHCTRISGYGSVHSGIFGATLLNTFSLNQRGKDI